MELTEILPKLKAHFPVADHVERDLPGKGKWFYIKWQAIRDRLDQVCPDLWEDDYTQPAYVGDFCVVICTITILGRSRQGIGSAPIVQISSKGKDMSRGNPIERATADAFKNAAEGWGIARYLDDQADDRTKQEFIRWMQKGGNGKAAVLYQEQQGQPVRAIADPPSKPFGRQPAPEVITDAQRKRLYAIATSEGKYTPDGFRMLVSNAGFDSSKAITKSKYDALCGLARDPQHAIACNQQAELQTA